MQKYNYGDYIKIRDDISYEGKWWLKPSRKGEVAIIMYSYAEKFPNNFIKINGECYSPGTENDYCLFFSNAGEVCWYSSEQLELIEKNRLDILEEWKKNMPTVREYY